MKPLRLLLADDHTVVRSGIRMLLQSFAGVEIVAEADGGQAALELVEKTAPDIALLDISMPDLSGIEVAALIRARFAQTRVVILSMHGSVEYVAQALQAGAAGYLLKDATPDELEMAIKVVARGETYLSPRVSGALVNKYVRPASSGPDRLDALSLRQREILQLIARGLSTKQIAVDLDVSIKTVETHRAQLMERLGIRDIAGLVRFAIRSGLISADE